MRTTCWFDYTCVYSHRAKTWLDAVLEDNAELRVDWRTFSLKEANRDHDSPSPFDDIEISSVSVLALALAHAARKADFDTYHDGTFRAFHSRRRRVTEADLIAIASKAGVDTAAFDQNRARWLRAVAAEHRHAESHHGVFGTPTLLLAGGAVVFLRLAVVPRGADAARLWTSLDTLARCHPELLEMKREVRRGG